ncbi:MAG TPA: ubiquinone/menaquinone biosynthesis methyltransferase [Planctomycetota bacterium]|nr:ubiquinone/menaquinone biosynthesis methyltransferase [Planctomycetota bacterium]
MSADAMMTIPSPPPVAPSSRNVGGKSAAETQAMFGAIAGRYDLCNHVLSGAMDLLWRARAAMELRGMQPTHILDMCCGTGDLAFAFGQVAPAHCQILGMDFCRPMLELARRKQATRPHPERYTFRFGDCLAIDLPDRTCDLAAVAFGIRNVTDVRAGLTELKRTLKPGGKLIILEFTEPKNPVVAPLMKGYLKNGLPIVGRVLSGIAGDAYAYLPQSISTFSARHAMHDHFQALNLTAIQVVPMTFGLCTMTVGTKPV